VVVKGVGSYSSARDRLVELVIGIVASLVAGLFFLIPGLLTT
jgi:UPF0716 family protein affecting phage T7 exclusion